MQVHGKYTPPHAVVKAQQANGQSQFGRLRRRDLVLLSHYYGGVADPEHVFGRSKTRTFEHRDLVVDSTRRVQMTELPISDTQF